MNKSITEQIEELQAENMRLKSLEKILDKIIKSEFGIERKKLHKIIEKQHSFKTEFIERIADFYGLESEQDYRDFLEMFCSEDFINYYNEKEAKIEV